MGDATGINVVKTRRVVEELDGTLEWPSCRAKKLTLWGKGFYV